MKRFAVPAVLLGGAVAYYLLRGAGEVSFNATPLIIGVIAAVATAVGPRPHDWMVPAVLCVWGLGVLAVRDGPLPDLEAPMFLIAVGLGLLIGDALNRGARRAQGVRSGALAIVAGGVLFYLGYVVPVLLESWPWSAGLAVWAMIDFLR